MRLMCSILERGRLEKICQGDKPEWENKASPGLAPGLLNIGLPVATGI